MKDNTYLYTPQEDIKTLMKLYGQEIKSKPELPDRETRLLRARLIFEEALEFVVASGCTISPKFNISDNSMIAEYEVVEADEDTNLSLVEMVDAIGDILVVTYGAANACGVEVQPVWDEIQRSNLSKVWPDGTIHKREDGKVLKPDTYSAADISNVLNKAYN